MGIAQTHLESVWNPSGSSDRGPLLFKPVTGQELFFAVSYSKPALVNSLHSSIPKNTKNSCYILVTFTQK
jgi:hypothetical protein